MDILKHNSITMVCVNEIKILQSSKIININITY